MCRALDVLRTVNKLQIASVTAIHEETGFPKPTIVRLLETLRAGGLRRARQHVRRLSRDLARPQAQFRLSGDLEVIEVARPLAIDLTQRLKWPIGIGVIDGDAIAIKFWTGAISPWAHTNTVLGLRPDLLTTAMGRAYLAFCPVEEREAHLARMRADPGRRAFGEEEEHRFRTLLDQVRSRRLRDAGSADQARSGRPRWRRRFARAKPSTR